jgi:hypothetical protein
MSHVRGRWKWFGPGGFSYQVIREYQRGPVGINLTPQGKQILQSRGVDIDQLSNLHHRKAWKYLKRLTQRRN